MKRILVFALALCFCSGLMAQSGFPAVDKSPLDISYYPNNYPVLKIQDKVTESLVARVMYSRPKKEGRTIFGGLVEYGKVWRLGANEATELEFFQKVNIGGKKISKGRYTLYAIVNENSWTFILNKDTDTWGAFKYSPDKDIVRVDVPVEKLSDPLEYLSIVFEKSTNGINLVVGWENVKASLPITL
jgi:hypothetical protein